MPRYPKGSTKESRATLVDKFTEHTRPAADAVMAAAYRAIDAPVVIESARPEPEYTPPMPIIKFESVTLNYEIPRPRVVLGLATQGTAFFDTSQPALRGYFIEFDTSTQLLRIGVGGVSVRLPMLAVKYFGLTLDERAALKVTQAEHAEKTRLANEAAIAESDAIAQRPAGDAVVNAVVAAQQP